MLALEGESKPKLGQRVDEVEGVDAAKPDRVEPDVSDESIGNVFCVAFLGGVEEIGSEAVEHGVGKVLPSQRAERAHWVGAVGELIEGVQFAGSPDIVRRTITTLPVSAGPSEPIRHFVAAPGTASRTTSALATASAIGAVPGAPGERTP